MSGLQMTGYTDPGRIRKENEDRIATRPELGLAVLADGMGGHQAGEVASGMAIDVIGRHFTEMLGADPTKDKPRSGGQSPATKLVHDAIQIANTAIYELAQQRPEYAGMGSTIVVVIFYGDKLCVGHAGDSRLYRYRNSKLEQLTEDHSVVQELVNRGLATPEEARITIGKNFVTRALGVDPAVVADIKEQKVKQADLYLLCSDGLNDVVSDQEIAALLADCDAPLESTVQRMIAAANERGGPDNISVILVRTGSRFTRDDQGY